MAETPAYQFLNWIRDNKEQALTVGHRLDTIAFSWDESGIILTVITQLPEHTWSNLNKRLTVEGVRIWFDKRLPAGRTLMRSDNAKSPKGQA